MGIGLGMIGSAIVGAVSKNNQAKKQDERNLEMNKEILGLQQGFNAREAEKAHERAKELTEINRQNNSYQEKVRQANEAGLSVGLLYGQGGAGGSSSGSTGSQANASGNMSSMAAERSHGLEVQSMINEQKLANAQEQKVRNETKLIEAQKENIEADTENKGAQTGVYGATTENLGASTKKMSAETTKTGAETEKVSAETEAIKALTPVQREMLRYSAIEKFIESNRREWENEGSQKYDEQGAYNNVLEHMTNISKKSYINHNMAAELAKAYSEINRNNATAALDNERKIGYWTELLNATISANAAETNAAANKLASLWNTGELTNWKTWKDTAIEVLRSLGEVTKVGVGAKVATDMLKKPKQIKGFGR